MQAIKNVRGTQLLRALLIGTIILLMQIPVAMIEGVIWERQQQRHTAVSDITGKWGGKQTLSGPFIVLPYKIPGKQHKQGWIEPDKLGQIVLLPKRYKAKAHLRSEMRQRSIYGVPLYQADIAIEGRFDLGEAVAQYDDGQRVLLWDQAVLSIGISDPKGLRPGTALTWNGQPIRLAPGINTQALNLSGFHASLAGNLDNTSWPFRLSLTLAGHDDFQIVPMGQESQIQISSDWADPSFQGNWLPTQREVNASGFNAYWEIPYLGRNFPEHWIGSKGQRHNDLLGSAVGVNLTYPLDTYGKTQRSTKYSLMFIGLTFISFWLFEMLSGVRIHGMQYLLIGAAISVFYLLLLSLSEHIGFLAAYGLAAAMVVGTITAYSIKLVRKRGRVVMTGLGLSALYGYLLALLQEQEYALLAGSLGLFAVLSAVMYLTRNIEWSLPERQTEPSPEQARESA